MTWEHKGMYFDEGGGGGSGGADNDVNSEGGWRAFVAGIWKKHPAPPKRPIRQVGPTSEPPFREYQQTTQAAHIADALEKKEK